MIEAATPALKLSQAAGTVRADLTSADLRILTAMLGSGLHTAEAHERNVIASRTLELVLDAIRAQPGAGSGKGS